MGDFFAVIQFGEFCPLAWICPAGSRMSFAPCKWAILVFSLPPIGRTSIIIILITGKFFPARRFNHSRKILIDDIIRLQFFVHLV